MKRGGWFANILIGVLAAAVLAVGLYKFFFQEQPLAPFRFDGFEKITVSDLDGSVLPLSGLAAEDGMTYCLIFEISDCPSCIFKGIEDLKRLKQAGKAYIPLLVHDLIDEVRGWSASNNFFPLYMLSKVDFYEHVHTPITPVMIKIKKNRVESYRYITP